MACTLAVLFLNHPTGVAGISLLLGLFGGTTTLQLPKELPQRLQRCGLLLHSRREKSNFLIAPRIA